MVFAFFTKQGVKFVCSGLIEATKRNCRIAHFFQLAIRYNGSVSKVRIINISPAVYAMLRVAR